MPSQSPVHISLLRPYFLWLYCWAWRHMIWTVFLVRLCLLSWLCPSLLLVALPINLLAGSLERGKNLTLCKHYSETTKALVCYPHYFHYKSKHSTTWATMDKIKSITTNPAHTGTMVVCQTFLPLRWPWGKWFKKLGDEVIPAPVWASRMGIIRDCPQN